MVMMMAVMMMWFISGLCQALHYVLTIYVTSSSKMPSERYAFHIFISVVRREIRAQQDKKHAQDDTSSVVESGLQYSALSGFKPKLFIAILG